MKKKLALVLAAAMVMGTVLTGCSSGGGSTQAAAPEATEAPKEAAITNYRRGGQPNLRRPEPLRAAWKAAPA